MSIEAIHIEPLKSPVARWGEGPFADAHGLTYVDIEGKTVHRIDLVSGRSLARWPVGQRVGCALPCSDGRLLCAGDHGFFLLNPDDGSCRDVADPEIDLPDNRFNDGKVAPDGYVFAGSISLKKQTGAANLWRMDRQGTVTKVLSGLTNSNGMAWSADGATVYHIDTPTKQVRAFDYHDGEFSHPRIAIDTSAIEGSPDGMTIDTAGRLWIAFCHGAAVEVFEPFSNRSLERIDLPCRETTSVCFGGPEHATLFVTTGISGMHEEPLAGVVFAVSGHTARGRPVDVFDASALA